MVIVYTLLIATIILLATIENITPSIIGFLATPPDYVFLGTVHHPGDYFYYLSQFTQGESRWLTTIDLFTSEQLTPSLIGWSNVLTGKIFSLVHLSPATAYQMSIVVLTAGVLTAAYILAHTILRSRSAATIALYFFALFHAFPVLRDGKPSYGDYWNNFAVPRVRFGGVPHQLMLHTASMILLYGLIQWVQYKKYSWKMGLVICVASFVLASLQPALWGIIAATAVATAAYRKQPVRSLLILLSASGMAPLLYITSLFRTLPFLQLKLWEAGEQNVLTLEHFILATGPILLLSLFAVPFFMTPKTYSRYLSAALAFFPILLFFSPIPAYIGISNARVLSPLTILLLSVIAAAGIESLVAHKKIIVRTMGVLLVAILSFTLLPNHQKTIKLVSTFDANNVYQYLPASEYRFFREIGATHSSRDIFLVSPPYNLVFPALSGKRSYHGHPLLTIEAEQKDKNANMVFTGALTGHELRSFLNTNGITHILAPQEIAHFASLSFLKRTTASKTLILYVVE